MSTQFFDVSGEAARVVFSHNLAFFTGHAAPQYATLREQTAAVLRRYDELFEKFGLYKKNIVYSVCFLKNADDEEEFAQEYFKWIDPENPPAGYTVTGIPIQHSPVGDNILIELQFIVATEPDAKIERFDVTRGARMVKYDGMAYFTGHVYPKGATPGEQAAGVLRRYDELFERFGLKKENVVALYGFAKDIGDYAAMGKPMAEYFGENPPAGVLVQAPPNQNTDFGPNLYLELAMFVATGDAPKIVRKDVAPGMSRVVEYNGLAWFTGHSARPGFDGLENQANELLTRYGELFDRFGYKRDNVVMAYGYVRDIEKYKEYGSAMRKFQNPERPAAGVLVQAPPAGEGNELELQFIVSLDD